tara:strand:+ start:253 stop:357 length:105 start_codon:yes stop_codon:yes gene_type:complete
MGEERKSKVGLLPKDSKVLTKEQVIKELTRSLTY